MPKRIEQPETSPPDEEQQRTTKGPEGIDDLELDRGDAEAVKGGSRPRYQTKLSESTNTTSP